MPATIRDIAREAQVSIATVSLVLRDSPLITAATQQRVREAMARLGYQRNRLAASLRTARSHILGLLLTDITFPNHAQLAVGVEEVVERAGYSLIVANSHESAQRERQHVAVLRQYQADGLLITPVEHETAHLAALCAEGYPFVLLSRHIPGIGADSCDSDGYAAMRRLVAHLAGDLGHHRIAFLSGTQRTSTSVTCLTGWRDELAARGLPAPDELAPVCRSVRSGGEEAMAALLAGGPAFTAVVCINDLVALGAMSALLRAGLRVPQDVSVAGMGGFPDVSPPGQPLTTAAYDYRELGRQGAALLLRRIEGGMSRAPERRIIPARLVVGATTAPPA